ncbi:MAG: polysaccharide deacetylase family protein [Chloroflexota bacterium]
MNVQWSQGQPFALALSHDVDRVRKRAQFLYYPVRAMLNRSANAMRKELQSAKRLICGDDPYWNFDRIMELEDSLGVRSTLFFMDEQGQPRLTNLKSQILYRGRYTLDEVPIQKAIQTLDANGWEIGLHGSYESYNNPSLLSREKIKLEGILGHPVHGTRQHYLRLDIPDTWHLHNQLGFVYDSTLGYTDKVGFRWDRYTPFYPTDPSTGEKIPILQIPMVIMDTPLLQCPDPWSSALTLIKRAEAENGVLTLNWHQRVFNPWDMQAYQDMYVRIIQECQNRGAWVGPMGQVAQTWTNVVNRG